ncbi:tRNA (N6-threonylcarbamoyladenosine(37)-N6)-methyltransferase TrmO [Candidatus Aerophobetes bacterium]|nr:tRNA (N6-threonylcarbamoyladenosine(37)-N6)-methyltransferase TrmO [Candidatus Aerophobetes bacterium]
MKIEIHPIGVVKNNLQDYQRIEIYEDFLEALKGIENFKYLWVLFWLHKVSEEDRKTLQVHAMGNFSVPKRGVFTTRSPRRPNPIGLTKVKFLKREKNIILVQGLDAFEGSPVLDIKIVWE